jgi:hypothetical protein
MQGFLHFSPGFREGGYKIDYPDTISLLKIQLILNSQTHFFLGFAEKRL